MLLPSSIGQIAEGFSGGCLCFASYAKDGEARNRAARSGREARQAYPKEKPLCDVRCVTAPHLLAFKLKLLQTLFA